MVDPKRVAERYLANYSPPADEKFGPVTQLLTRPKSQHDLPTREQDADDPHSHHLLDSESELPGNEVNGNDDPNDNTDRDTGDWPVKMSPNREKQRALPIPSGHPPQRDRSLIRPVYNVPDAQPGSRYRDKTITPVRTPGTPGDQYGTPTKYDYNTPTRRTMTSDEQEHEAMIVRPPRSALPKTRQKNQVGPAKMYYKKRYRGRAKNVIKRRMKRRYKMLKKKPAFMRRENMRDQYPKRYKRRGVGYRSTKDRSRDWRKDQKIKERNRGVPQHKKQEKRREKDQREQAKRTQPKRGNEAWRFPMILGGQPIEIYDFNPETGEILYEIEGNGQQSASLWEFLNEANVYREEDIDWLTDVIEHEFGADVWDYLEDDADEGYGLEDAWEEGYDGVDGEKAAFDTFHRVQDKPSNLDQNAPKSKKNKGTPRQDRKRNDYMSGPPSPGGSKGKEAPTSWVGPMTSQPGIANPSKDHKHRGQPHANPDLTGGFPQPAVEQQSGSAKVIPDVNRSTGDLSWRNKNKFPTSLTADTVVETTKGPLLVEMLGWDLCSGQVVVGDPATKEVLVVPHNAVCHDANHKSRTADTIAMIRRRAERALFEKAMERPASLASFEERRLTWTFKSGKWKVKLRAMPEPGSKAVNVMKMAVRCACSCPFWRWQGPEHWGREYDWQYGRLRGTGSEPVIRDPKFRHPVCKHVIAVFDYVEQNKLKIPVESRRSKLARYLVDRLPNCEPSTSRVAERFLGTPT